jgi:formate C-acetyltransferase
MANLIRSYFELGGYHCQFNVISPETLRDAQEHPDNYRDLVVRVAGYCAIFNDLSKEVQNEIIRRTTHERL